MSEPTAPVPTPNELIGLAKAQCRRQLAQAPHLLNPEAARRVVDEYAHRLVPFSTGVVRALRPGDNSAFFEVTDMENPLAGFVSWLADGVPDADRLEAVAARQDRQRELIEEHRRNPNNRFL